MAEVTTSCLVGTEVKTVMFIDIKYLLFRTILLFLSTIRCEGRNNERSTLSATEFAFGGAIYMRVNQTAQNDPQLETAAKFAMNKMYDYSPSTNGQKEGDFTITSGTISKLLYSEDGRTPFWVRVADPDTGQIQHYPLAWGVYYSINLSVPHSNGHLYQHSLIVFQFWDGVLYLFQHIFKQQSGMPLRKIESGSQPIDSLQKDSILCRTTGFASQCYEESQCYSSHMRCELESCIDQSLHSCKSVSLKTAFCRLLQNNCDIRINHIKNSQPTDKSTLQRKHQYISTNSTYTLKVLSFNIWNFNVVTGGDAGYMKRVHHIAALCRETDADVIGLQEVRFEEGQGGSLGPNQMAHLAELLPDYQYTFQPAQVQTHVLPNMSVEGLAFLSKHPITGHDFLFLTMDPRDPADGRQRILHHVEISLPVIGKVHIFNTHLSLSHKARATSVLQIWDYVNTFQGPAFLMGDWNAEPHNVEVQFLDGRSSLRGVQATGLHDVWRLKHGLDVKGFTFSSKNKKLTKRLDIIFMREHKRVSLKDVGILDDKTRGKHAASDHLGLVAEFVIRE